MRGHTGKARGIALALRSLVFSVFFLVTLLFYVVIIGPFLLPFRFRTRYRVLSSWADINISVLKRVCGVDFRISGLQNMPTEPCIVMSNHQSTWETLAVQGFLPPVVWVIKRELLWLPIFGWGLAMIEPISLNRGSGRSAVDQLVSQGRARLDAGRWIIIFPEGTRVAPDQHKRYKMGGAILASRNDVPILPIAHNAGYLWPRRHFVKYPGVIDVRIGEPITTTGKTPEEINREVRTWIEAARAEIGAPGTS
ncbi:MAG: lysophospholipid acyltransferase family protein [Pseudomonadota bacterium]|nr:lysophospholipid acyltransferase family protein [Pseudomonadota bacterium]